MAKKKVGITELALRDSHQSLLATRMRTVDMIPIAEKIDNAGYWSIEMWGGATFDACVRFLNEDPWQRIRDLKKVMPKTPFQMLLRGQNLVGYRNYADDVVVRFIELAADAGIDIFRVFDALNDPRNLKTSFDTVKRAGKRLEGTLSYTISPVHNTQMFVDLAQEMVQMGADTICIKDMAGLLYPEAAYELISRIKEKVDVPLHLHGHCTSGLANFMYLRAIQAGIDIIDCSTSSLSQGTSHPPTESIVAMLQGAEYETGVDLQISIDIGEYFLKVRDKYKKYESKFTGVDLNILKSQIPGGMFSNLEAQLKQQGALDKINLVLEEVPKVRKDLGYPPLVTPTSQIVGTQAVLNVLLGERYKMISKESAELIKGNYGKLPADPEKKLLERVLGGAEPTKGRPADNLAPELDKIRKELPDHSDEDIIVYALFPQIAKSYFKNKGILPPDFFEEEPAKNGSGNGTAVAAAAAAAQTQKISNPQNSQGNYTVSVDGKQYNVVVK